MGELRAVIHDGEYEVIFNEGTGELHAFRHGVEWRDLTGDNLVLSMLMTIVDQEEKLFEKQFEVNASSGEELSNKAKEELDNIISDSYKERLIDISEKINIVTRQSMKFPNGSEERKRNLELQIEYEREKLDLYMEWQKLLDDNIKNEPKEYETTPSLVELLEKKIEKQGVEQDNNPFFRMVSKDASIDAIENLLSQLTTLSTGLVDGKWIVDTDGFILGDGILRVSTENPKDAEFYGSAIDIVLYLLHEVKRLREGYEFLSDASRSQKLIDWTNPIDTQNYAVSVLSMASNNLNGISHNGNKRKFFAYGKELPN